MGSGGLDMGALSFQTVPPGGEPTRFGDVRRFEDVDSTNRVALQLAVAGVPEGVVVVADHQTAGRGRRGRRWDAPPGSSLLASVLLRPPVAPWRAHVVAMAVALAATDACHEVAGVRPALKWPNDLVAGDGPATLAGVLAESLVQDDRLVALVVGTGLNVTSEAAGAAGAVALEDLAGRPVDVDAVLSSWLVHLERRYGRLLAPGGSDDVLAAYRQRCATLGRLVRAELVGGVLEGRAVTITDAGHLVVATAGGRREIAAADVVHLRPSLR